MSPYEAGYDCGINGAGKRNCHFSFFGSIESMKEWERGKHDADRLSGKRNKQPRKVEKTKVSRARGSKD